nr:hypothetical protein [Saliphagus sp. LR7]
MEAVGYEPQFTGLVSRLGDVNDVILLFGSGKPVINGGTQPTDAEDAITAVHSRLGDLGLLD